MIKKFKIFEKHYDIDPYGEEDWEDDDLSLLLRIAKHQNKPYDQVISLDCSHNQLNSLEGIENLVNLKELQCNNNQLTNLKGIEKLVKLESLYCWNNRLTNLKGIEKLVNLKVLYFWNNKFSIKYERYLTNYFSKKIANKYFK